MNNEFLITQSQIKHYLNNSYPKEPSRSKRKKIRELARNNAHENYIDNNNKELPSKEEENEQDDKKQKKLDLPAIQCKLMIVGVVLLVLLILGGIGYFIYKMKTMYKSTIKSGINEALNFKSNIFYQNESQVQNENNEVQQNTTDTTKYTDII